MCGRSCRDWNWFFTPLCGFWVSAQFIRLASLGSKDIYLMICLTRLRQGLAVLCSPGSWTVFLTQALRCNWFLVLGFMSTCLYPCMRSPVHVETRGWSGVLTLHLILFDTRSLTEARAHWVQLDWLASKSEGSTCLCLSVWIIGTQSVMGKASTWMIRIKHRSLCLHGKHFAIESCPWYLNCLMLPHIS